MTACIFTINFLFRWILTSYTFKMYLITFHHVFVIDSAKKIEQTKKVSKIKMCPYGIAVQHTSDVTTGKLSVDETHKWLLFRFVGSEKET